MALEINATFEPDGTIVYENSFSDSGPGTQLIFNADGTVTVSGGVQVVPLTTAPSQTVNVTLNGQVCRIDVFTKSLFVPISPPLTIVTTIPVYENQNPVFMNLYLNDALVLGGVPCLHAVRMVRDTYLEFIGDLVMLDTSGAEGDPEGVPYRLPPLELMNAEQRALPLSYQGSVPASIANTIPGLGTRFVLTYWPNLA